MKIVVLGSGLIGSAIAEDLCHRHEVTSADINENNLKNLADRIGVRTERTDVTDATALARLISKHDLVVGAVPGFMGFSVLKNALECGKPVVDISFFPENAMALDARAKELGVCAIVDCGVAPGMSNMIAGYHYGRMKMNKYECLVGGLPVVREFPFEYKAVFSPIDVIEEYTRPARFVTHGELVVREALSDVEEVFFEGVGTVESFNTDGLRTLADTLPGVPDMIEKTLRYPGHVRLMRAFRETGLFSQEKVNVGGVEVSPLELTAKLMFPKWKLQPGEEDLTIMRVLCGGEENGKQITHLYHLHDRYDRIKGVTSMARTTAYTCTAAVELVSRGLYTSKGVSPPEHVGADEKCFRFVLDYLAERGVHYRHEIS